MTRPVKSSRQRTSSPLALHIGAVVVLLLIAGALIVKLGLDWAQTEGSTARIAASDQAQLQSLIVAAAPFHGLESRVADTRIQIDKFLSDRIPASYSAIASRIDEIGSKSGVRLSHVEYSQGAKGNDLTEVSIDCGVDGEYPQIMRFANGLERDQTFFVVRSMMLNGQQGGHVDLRLQVSTWLRPAEARAMPVTAGPGTAAAAAVKSEKE